MDEPHFLWLYPTFSMRLCPIVYNYLTNLHHICCSMSFAVHTADSIFKQPEQNNLPIDLIHIFFTTYALTPGGQLINFCGTHARQSICEKDPKQGYIARLPTTQNYNLPGYQIVSRSLMCVLRTQILTRSNYK